MSTMQERDMASAAMRGAAETSEKRIIAAIEESEKRVLAALEPNPSKRELARQAEEGLREAAELASSFAEAASSNADRLGQPSVWESAARTTARDIASAILALIPTKPEAKEGQLPGELLQAYNLAIHRKASGSSDFATVVELLRTAYPTIDRASVERFPPTAALRSKKPE